MTRLVRVLEKPPRVILQRLAHEAGTELDRIRGPYRSRRLDDRRLLAELDAHDLEELWQRTLARPYPFVRPEPELAEIEQRWPGDRGRVLQAADQAIRHVVDVLGTGPVELGTPIDWNRDWKSGHHWPRTYGRRLDVADLDRPSDVKVPWEISRVQWLLPAGQAFLLTGDERYAACARDVLVDWIDANPYLVGVNWALAMEAALRVFSWTYLLYACGSSDAWSDDAFRSAFLRALFLQIDFVARNLERSDINGNHLTADAAALVVGGLVLGVPRWADDGWGILVAELPRQVHSDGVDFEGSAAYHRLVGELFALPALLRVAHGLDVPGPYVARLHGMAQFTRAYTAPDGRAPLWGDADDGRALPLGAPDVNDHRSLPVLVAALTGDTAAGNEEGAWLVGPCHVVDDEGETRSVSFPDAGVYILAAGDDHVFIDCGPVGLAGRGGHGHNDCLSFEATLAGTRIVRDAGTYVYTGSAELRNAFRSTAFHNTPLVDGAEQSRLDPGDLWRLAPDAVPDARSFDEGAFSGAHAGYRRLSVTPVRTFELDAARHRLTITDAFEGVGEHLIVTPLQLVPEAQVVAGDASASVRLDDARYEVLWESAADWTVALESGWVSERYGVRREAPKLVWSRRGTLKPLRVEIGPTHS